MRYDNILQTIGNTPTIRLGRLAPAGVNVHVKVEAFNPGGSVKDRMAREIIESAERSGELQPGQTIVEATSGNTGIALAMVCAQKGYPLVLTMAENFSIERRRLMRFLGAKVVLTPASEKGSGMLAKAVELADKHGWFLCRQFENEANAEAHSRTTAREILADFAADGLDYWVTGFGTGGTLKGTARVLRQHSPRTRIVVCEPDNAPVLSSGIVQERDANGHPLVSHPMFRPHLMQGWSPDFVARLTEDARSEGLIDIYEPISGAEALSVARRLAREEGILAGISSGATLAGALQLARRVRAGSNILCMLTDTGERYLSTQLYADVETGMSESELEISRSTPRCRFDTQSPVATAGQSVPVRDVATSAATSPLDPVADKFVQDAVSSREHPVVMFALEWCEFCWSVRKLFARLEIEHRSVDLDSVAYQADDRGGKIRAALRARIGVNTIPQIFVGGQHVGGCSETLDAYRSGSLQQLLRGSGVGFAAGPGIDPSSLLPTWLHSRGNG